MILNKMAIGGPFFRLSHPLRQPLSFVETALSQAKSSRKTKCTSIQSTLTTQANFALLLPTMKLSISTIANGAREFGMKRGARCSLDSLQIQCGSCPGLNSLVESSNSKKYGCNLVKFTHQKNCVLYASTKEDSEGSFRYSILKLLSCLGRVLFQTRYDICLFTTTNSFDISKDTLACEECLFAVGSGVLQ